MENVSRVVGWLFRKVSEAIRILDKRAGALEAHTSIHVLSGEIAERAISFGIVLNENEVPNLDTQIGVHVDKSTAGVAVRCHVNMQLRAGTTWTRFTHHPEVVFDVTVDDVNFRIQPLCLKELRPDIPCLLVKLRWITFSGRIDSSIQPLRRAAPAFYDKLPPPLDGFLFKIITKGPVP